MPILGLVGQESMRAVAAMSKKTTVKSDFTRFLFHRQKRESSAVRYNMYFYITDYNHVLLTVVR